VRIVWSLENRQYRTDMFNREVLTLGDPQSIYELAAQFVDEISIKQTRKTGIFPNLLIGEQMGRRLPAQPLLSLSAIFRLCQKAGPEMQLHRF